MLGGSNFSFLISSNLRFYCFPINLNVTRKLLKLIIRLFTLIHLKEAFSIGNNSVNVSFIIYCYFKCSLPFIKLNI